VKGGKVKEEFYKIPLYIPLYKRGRREVRGIV